MHAETLKEKADEHAKEKANLALTLEEVKQLSSTKSKEANELEKQIAILNQ